MQTNWSLTNRFKRSEWPGDAGDMLDPLLLHAVFRLRSKVPYWCYMTPSPLYEGHIRHKGSSSRHSTEKGTRRSDATDLFLPSWKAAFVIWQEAQQTGFGGIGLYTDTVLGGVAMPMMHLDMRSDRLMWVRNADDGYVYFVNDPQLFLEILARQK